MFLWSTGPAMVGAAVHMVNSMMLGLVFGVVARLLPLGRLTGLATGMVFGLLVMALTHWLAQPAAAALGASELVADIGPIVGWGAWTVAHLLFGGMLGLWVASRPQDVAGDGQPLT